MKSEEWYQSMAEAHAIRIKTNSRRLRVTRISMGHTIRIARIVFFFPAVLLGCVMAAMIGYWLELGGRLDWRTFWQWAITIVASMLVCFFALKLFVDSVVRCFVDAFNVSSQLDKDDSGVVIRVRELTEEEERDVDSYTV